MNISVCMSFRNEGNEVAETCKSIRETAGDIPIICVNDGSDDGINYQELLKPYNVVYYKSLRPMGSSLGRQMAIDLVETEWFILLDAHCRFITKDWLQKLDELNLSPNGIYCCGCEPFNDKMDFSYLVKAKGLGARFNRDNKLTMLNPKWNPSSSVDATKIFDTEIILGANYISSKKWWDKIGGHHGFRRNLREEAFLSIKTRMAGGLVQCIPFIITAHKFRKKPPFTTSPINAAYNELAIIYICANDLFPEYVKLEKEYRGNDIVNEVLLQMDSNMYELETERQRIKKIAIKSFEESLYI